MSSGDLIVEYKIRIDGSTFAAIKAGIKTFGDDVIGVEIDRECLAFIRKSQKKIEKPADIAKTLWGGVTAGLVNNMSSDGEES